MALIFLIMVEKLPAPDPKGSGLWIPDRPDRTRRFHAEGPGWAPETNRRGKLWNEERASEELVVSPLETSPSLFCGLLRPMVKPKFIPSATGRLNLEERLWEANSRDDIKPSDF